jgi:3-hydroxybutyryl-CoA dehydrogenase
MCSVSFSGLGLYVRDGRQILQGEHSIDSSSAHSRASSRESAWYTPPRFSGFIHLTVTQFATWMQALEPVTFNTYPRPPCISFSSVLSETRRNSLDIMFASMIIKLLYYAKCLESTTIQARINGIQLDLTNQSIYRDRGIVSGMESIRTVCVVGAGYMGSQIGLQCASHGFPVAFHDVSPESLELALSSVKEELGKRVAEDEATPEEERAVLSRITATTDLEEAAYGVDLVIEAVPERLELKREVFRWLDEVCEDHVILATNSSSIRVSKIEGATCRPDRVLNMHFYSGPWRRSIVELMRGTSTSDDTMLRAREFAEAIGVTPLVVLRESTGFIFNRVWRAVKRECLHLVDEGIASFEDVDRAWICLYGTEMGPFGMMDRVGLDVVRDIEMVYYEESDDERDRPPRVLLEKIERGELGVKKGKGFYSYPDPAFREPSWLRKKGASG